MEWCVFGTNMKCYKKSYIHLQVKPILWHRHCGTMVNMCRLWIFNFLSAKSLQISAFFLFSNFRKGRLLYIHPVSRSVDVTIIFFNIYRHISPLLTQYHLIPNSTAPYWPSTTKYQPVPPYIDPVPSYINVPRDKIIRNSVPRDNFSARQIL